MPLDKGSGNMDPRLALALSEIDAIVKATPNLTLDKDYFTRVSRRNEYSSFRPPEWQTHRL